MVYIPCDACGSEGLTPGALDTVVAGAPAHVWLNGSIGDLPSSLRRPDTELSDVRLSTPLAQLPKYQLALLLSNGDREHPARSAAKRYPKKAKC